MYIRAVLLNMRRMRFSPMKPNEVLTTSELLIFQGKYEKALVNIERLENTIELSGEDRVRSWIGAPLLIAQKMIGYLTVDRYLPNTFVSTDADLAQAFAHQVAQTIHNAQLFTKEKSST